MMDKELKQSIITENKLHDTDTGSPEVQIALLSERIAELTEHMRANKHDNSTRHGLMALVSRRKRLLKYLAKENHAKYLEIAEKFGIRGVIAK